MTTVVAFEHAGRTAAKGLLCIELSEDHHFHMTQPASDRRATRNPSLAHLRGAVERSVNEVRSRDAAILGTTERVVVGRLMIYLSRELAPWDSSGLVLDQEYERAGGLTKALVGGAVTRKIVPDLIYHRRGSHDRTGNLLAIEVKLYDTEGGKLHDIAKLSVLTGRAQQAYVFPYSLRLEGDPPPADPPEPGWQRPATWRASRRHPGDLLGMVGLPNDPLTGRRIHPYRHGVWVLITATQTQYIWLSRRSRVLHLTTVRAD